MIDVKRSRNYIIQGIRNPINFINGFGEIDQLLNALHTFNRIFKFAALFEAIKFHFLAASSAQPTTRFLAVSSKLSSFVVSHDWNGAKMQLLFCWTRQKLCNLSDRGGWVYICSHVPQPTFQGQTGTLSSCVCLHQLARGCNF